jgi:hypothetical protein
METENSTGRLAGAGGRPVAQKKKVINWSSLLMLAVSLIEMFTKIYINNVEKKIGGTGKLYDGDGSFWR